MNKRITELKSKRAAQERGFTLIELLVVIIILGILAAVVVFAVNGVGDKGQSAASATDIRTLRTAQEAYCAQTGNYAEDEDALVQAGLLSEGSSLHDTFGYDNNGGPCQGDSFVVTCDPEEPVSCQEGATPDGNFDGSNPQGMWTRTGDLPAPANDVGGAYRNMVAMPNGKVLYWGATTNAPPAADYLPGPVAVYDPASGTWTSTPPLPGGPSPTWFPLSLASLVMLQGGPAECGSLCGKVIASASVRLPISPATYPGFDYPNTIMFVFDPVAFDNPGGGSPVWTKIANPTVAASGFALIPAVGTAITPLQMNCSRSSNPGSDCGKILMVGGDDPFITQRGGTTEPYNRTVLYDPSKGTGADAFELVTTAGGSASALCPCASATSDSSNRMAIALNDGRILSAAGDSITYSPFLVNRGWTEITTTPAVGATAVYRPDQLRYRCSGQATNRLHSTAPPRQGTTVRADGRVVVAASAIVCAATRTVQNETGSATNIFDGNDQRNSILYDPTNDTWSRAGAASPIPESFCPCAKVAASRRPQAVTLPSSVGGQIVTVYGRNEPPFAASIGLFDGTKWTAAYLPFPVGDGSTEVASNTTAPMSVVALPSGQILLAGTNTASNLETFLYTPALPRP